MNRLNSLGSACATPAYQQARVVASREPLNQGEAPLPPEITGAEALFKMPFKLLFLLFSWKLGKKKPEFPSEKRKEQMS